MQQYVKGLAHHNEEDGEKLARLLRQIKGFLWHGNLHDGQLVIEDLVVDLDEVETDYASIKALRKTAAEFETYIVNNKDMMPNGGDTASASLPALSRAPSTRSLESALARNSRCVSVRPHWSDAS